METPCNGGGTCGKCKVRLDDETRSQRVRRVETKVLTAEEIADGWATLCSTLVDGDIALDLPGAIRARSSHSGGRPAPRPAA